MEGKPLLQSSEQTERGHRRRLSSILKSTHSPLKDVGSGKEPSQEPTIDKRQRGSRRVSFAETIRVFTPELQSAGSDDKENEGYTTSNSCTDIYKGAADKYVIAGMETLLHGPIQVPGHNSDWNYAKDRTIVFSSDNDMDMTASNTVTIHGLTDEGTQKIDTKQFLASLQSQNSKEVVKNQNFSLSTTGEKHFDAKRNSSMENKIKFSDFLASLGGEKSKASGAYDDNQTVLFTCDQQDMEMTRSHTVSIDNKVLSEISKRQSTNILKEQSSKFNKESGNHLGNNTMSEYEQNDMDITRSHTTAIENKILEGVKATNADLDFQNSKRKSILDLTANAVTSGICLQGEDMDFTKSNSGNFSEVRRAPSMTFQNNTPLFRHDQDDMDMTCSHTIAIKNTFLQGIAQIRRSVPNVHGDDMELTKSHTMIIDELNQLALHNQSINLQNITSTSSDNLGTELKMCCAVNSDHKVLKQQLHNETVHQEGEMEMTNVNVGLLLDDGESRPWNEGNPVFEALQENTMCLYDKDDMDMTRAHTVAIENKAISELDKGLSSSNAMLSTSLVSKSPLRDLKYTSKPHSVIDFNEKRYTNQTLCEPDMDITMLNTFILDSQKPGSVSHPGPKYKILSSVSNQSETRDGDAFNTQSRNQLENSPVSDSQDKTLFFYDQKDMDITRSHTTAIESKILEGVNTKNVTTEFKNMNRKSVLDFTTNTDDMASVDGSGKSFQGEDIDITRSNTVFIDHISDQPHKGTHTSEVFSRRKSVSSRPKPLVPSDEIILPACNMKQTNAIAYLVNKASIDKTTCNDGDMEMTRSHTVAIESKMLEDVKAKIVTADYLNMKRESVLDLTTNAGDLADDLTCRISFQGDDMDITKSNTVFIDQILHNKSADISKRKSVSCLPKSLVPNDEPILQVCKMENSSNVDRTVRLENKTSIDKTVSNQGDMEMTTRSHTVAIESEILNGAKAKNVTAEIDAKKKSVSSEISFHGEDMDITRSNTVFIDHIPDQKPHISDVLSRRKSVSSRPKSLVPSAERNLPVYYMDETFANAQLTSPSEKKCPVDKTICNEDEMEITRSHTLAIESNILAGMKAKNVPAELLDAAKKSFIDRTTNAVNMVDILTSERSFNGEDMDITKSNTVYIDQISEKLQNKGIHISEDLSKRKSLSCAKLLSSDETTLLVCNMEETSANVDVTENLVRKSSVDKTVCNENDMEMTRCHTVAIESKILDGAKAKNVTAGFPSTKRKSVLQADDFTSRISFQCDDMDITKSNTVFIDQISDELYNKRVYTSDASKRKSVSSRLKSSVPSAERKVPVCIMNETYVNAQLSEGLVNKCPVDKTISNEDEMEMTRSHTLAIESNILDGIKAKNVTAELLDDTKKSFLVRTTNGGNMVDDLTSEISFHGEDMDITKSNTVFIDQISEKLLNKGVHVSDGLSKRKSLSCAKLLSSDEKMRLACNMEETSANVDVTENLVRKSSVVNTECHKGDMEMTRCHTVAIESKILDGTMTKNVTAGFWNMKNTPVLDLIGNASDKTDNLSSEICFQGEDMDITKSNTVFIDEISDLHNKNASVSQSISNRKSVSSRPRSLVPADDTILQVCNMEKTHVNVHLPEGLESKSSVDKTLCNDGDMEMTRSHTVAIENKSFEAAYISCPSKTCSQVSLAMASCGQASTCDKITTSRPKLASIAESVPPSVSESTSYNDLIVPIETHDASMNISVRELSKLQGNNVLAASNKILPLDCNTKLPSDPDMDITESNSTVEVKFLDNNRHIPSSSIGIIKDDGGKACQELLELESTERLEICRRKSYARSLSLPVKSGIFLEGLGNGELPQVHTSPVEDVSLLKPGPYNTELDLIVEKSNTVGFIDHQNRPISFRNSLSANVNSKVTPNSVIGVDCKIESLEENCVSNYKSVSDKVKSQLISAKIENLNASNGLQPVGDPLIYESNLITSESKDCSTEQPTACVPQVETYQKDPEVALDIHLKKVRSKGKRVSFCFREMDIVAVDEILENVIKPASQQEIRDAVEHQDRTIHATEDINDFRLISQASDTENLEDLALHQEHDTSNINVLTKGISSELEVFGNPAELSEESRNQRRSVTSVLLSIKSLTQKPIFSPHHTAPVSSLIDQLPATSQILCPSRSVTDQVFVSSEMANKETIQEKEPTERTKTMLMEFCLPSRRSVKMFPPKLPNKRASSTSNLEMDVSSVSEAQPKNEGSKVLFKALNDIEYGQCIGEEMLPDDQEINGIFDYEVPEGAWEELCKKEAIQQNVNVSTSQPKDSMNGQKRGRNTEPESESQREKRGRLDEDEGQSSTAFKSSDKTYISDYSTPHASKGIEQTCNSTSSQDSRADGMSVELSSQQCSQMDSQLPWNSRCEQSLWQNFQDGSITVQEFFVLLGIRILIQKPRYSELPSKRGMAAELTPSEILLDQYIYQPKLQVYDEECHTLFQAIEELKVSTERQHKPLVQVNSLLWEALRMCSENELMCFGATLKNMKSLYSKKSKLLAHKAKVSTYSKLLRTAQMQKEQLQARLSAADQLLAELSGCISSLHMEPVKHDGECRTENRTAEVQGSIQADIYSLKSQESMLIRENLELEERKQNLLTRLGSLQEESQVIGERLQEPSFTEWELVKWTDTEAAFNFLYNSLELSISFGDSIDGENFNNQPCRRISRVTVESQLDDASAPPSTVLVHRLISQYIEKKSAFHEAYKTQNDLPQLLFNLSLVVSRCKLLGEELENLTRWGAIYNVVKVHIQSQEVSLLFSSLATLVKFELIIHLSDTYPTTPLSFTLNNRIGSITKNRVTEIMSKVPIGLWYLKRTVKSLNENLLV
ncbi:outer kinetochore KNL1 complex subunit KNL1 [Dendrobates tinctorius]|uniref:outer kinetochore KNL1 complex subunit KNL1 n=1 Tax=Dendrobates tinctorius TaxID=92724 RepID=UPI003CC9BF46